MSVLGLRARSRSRSLARPAAAVSAAVVGLSLVMPAAHADTYSAGISTHTIWSSSTPLKNARGQSVPGLRTAAEQGVSEVKFGLFGDAVVAEKGGRIAYFPSTRAKSGTLLTDRSGKDLSADTLAIGDTGLGGVALDPAWPLRPYIYAFYVSNNKLDGSGKYTAADCPPDGRCIVDAKIERLTIGWQGSLLRPTPYIASRKVIVGSGWCQGARTHSVGDLIFDRHGYLYAAAGDGTPEYGGSPAQASGCASQVTTKYPSQMAPLDVLDPSVKASLNGKIIRINPATGDGVPGNPMATSSDPNRRRIFAIGWRNPYRMTRTPGRDELTISVVGQSTRETVYTLPTPKSTTKVANAGWPCWEGTGTFASGPLCNGLSIDNGTVMTPLVQWLHGSPLIPGEPCPSSGASASMGVAYAGRHTARGYGRALFFGDYARGCIWARKSDGSLNFVANFERHTVRDLTTGPGGRVYFTDYRAGSVRVFDVAR